MFHSRSAIGSFRLPTLFSRCHLASYDYETSPGLISLSGLVWAFGSNHRLLVISLLETSIASAFPVSADSLIHAEERHNWYHFSSAKRTATPARLCFLYGPTTLCLVVAYTIYPDASHV